MDGKLVVVESRRQNFMISDAYDPRVRGRNVNFDPLWISRESTFEVVGGPNDRPVTYGQRNSHHQKYYSPITPALEYNDCIVTNWDYIGHLRTIKCDDTDGGYYTFKFVCEEA